MKRALFIFLIFLSQFSFCQNGLTEFEVEMNLIYAEGFGQRMEFTFQKGKPKKLDFEGMVYFNPGDYLPESDTRFERIITPATKFYFQKSDLKIHPLSESDSIKKAALENYIKNNSILHEEIIDGELYSYQLPREKIEEIYKPFYFKKHEVTNAEYWDFIFDVASTYHHSFKHEDMTYSFVDNDKDGELTTIPIYPDTTCWRKVSRNQPFTREYFSNEIYADYPIVGVSYYQAKAFCHWKTEQLQKSLGKKHKHFKLKVDLPNAVEWEWMAVSDGDKNPLFNSIFLTDKNWMLDLVIKKSNRSKRKFNIEVMPSFYYDGALPIDGGFFTNIADLEDKDLHKEHIKRQKKTPNNPNYLDDINSLNVSGMGNNVSEWLRDTYSENWEFMFQRQLKLWEQENTTESLLIKQIALYYDSHADKDGQLVKGANWLDERFSNIKGKNKAGIHAKTFISPAESHSTIGFRYVIYFSEE